MLKSEAAGAAKLKAEAAETAEMEVGAAEATGAGRRDIDGPEGGNAEAAIKGSVERDWGEGLAPALVGAGEEAREESRAKTLAASSTADCVVGGLPAGRRSGKRFRVKRFEGGHRRARPRGLRFYAVAARVLTCAIRARTSSSGARNCNVEDAQNSVREETRTVMRKITVTVKR